MDEDKISLAQAAGLIPAFRPGRKTSTATITRWIVSGKLEALRMGGRWVTSREAVRRMAERQTAAKLGKVPAPLTSPAQRQREVSLASRELDRIGL